MEYIITDEELERICDLVHDTHRDLLGQIRLRPLQTTETNTHWINMRLCGRSQITLNIKIKILRLL